MIGHTPGPWQIDAESDSGSFEIWGGSIESMAPMICLNTEENPDRAQEAKANARLIAAAPDMLEALTVIADWDTAPITDEGKQSLLDIIKSICDRARSEIAKASLVRGGK